MNIAYLKSKGISKYGVYYLAEVIKKGFNAKDLGLEQHQFDKVVENINNKARQLGEVMSNVR